MLGRALLWWSAFANGVAPCRLAWATARHLINRAHGDAPIAVDPEFDPVFGGLVSGVCLRGWTALAWRFLRTRDEVARRDLLREMENIVERPVLYTMRRRGMVKDAVGEAALFSSGDFLKP